MIHIRARLAWVATVIAMIPVFIAAPSAAAGLPDLVVKSVSLASTTVEQGAKVGASDRTFNRGPGRAASSVTRYYVSSDIKRSTNDRRVAGRSVPRLGVNAGNTRSVQLSIPANLTPGSWFVLACADATRVVRERNEQNNCRASASQLTVMPFNQPPTATIIPPDETPEAGDFVEFNSTSGDADGAVVARAWDLDGDLAFDDGTSEQAFKQFHSGGVFPIRFRVTDDGGKTTTARYDLVVAGSSNADRDGDGTLNGHDCAPDDPEIYPFAPGDVPEPEAPFVDSNCDGIDGTAGTGIVVDGELGADDSTCGVGFSASPCRTIERGLFRATQTGRSSVFVTEGTYHEAITVLPGVSIYGGYPTGTRANWCFTDCPARGSGITTIRNSTASLGRVVAVTANNLGATATKLQLLRITTGSGTGVGVSVYGVRVVDSPGLTLERVTIETGHGSAGGAGSAGTSGSDGTNGINGASGSCSSTTGGTGGSGGIKTVGGDNISGGNGGAGAMAPAGTTHAVGTAGQPGQGGAGPSGGTAGSAGTAGGDLNPDPIDGGDGGKGGDGSDGAAGNGGSDPFGLVSAGFWSGIAGQSGANGGNGGGGGGGGGGGMASITSEFGRRASGGGGGGSGAAGGTAGSGGSAGGGSFGLFVANTVPGPGPVVTNSSITSGDGGTGGTGGIGALGGKPGRGGIGGPSACGGKGGNGGDGGWGGDGGHGGGGAGGASYAVFSSQATGFDPAAVANANVFSHGSGGTGGSSLGNAGSAGASGNVRII